MSASPEEQQEMNEKLTNRILNALQEGIQAKEFGEAELILGTMTIVEVLDAEGHPRISVLISDTRITSNLGMAVYAQAYVMSSIGGGGPS